MELILGSWSESSISKVNRDQTFFGIFFKIKLFKFHHSTFDLLEIDLCILFFYWVILINFFSHNFILHGLFFLTNLIPILFISIFFPLTRLLIWFFLHNFIFQIKLIQNEAYLLNMVQEFHDFDGYKVCELTWFNKVFVVVVFFNFIFYYWVVL